MKNGWRKVKLVEIADIIMGQSPSSDYYNTEGDGIPFFQGCAEFSEFHPLVEKYCNKPTRLAKKGDVLMSVRAPVGELNIADRECCIGRGLCAIRSKTSDFFVYYLLKTNLSLIHSFSGGTTYQSINKTEIHNLTFDVPPEITREKIASILSGYDDLIENNTRRIKILEEMALAIYREWFVEFRFSNVECRMPLRPAPSRWDESPFGNGTRVPSGNDELRMATPEEKKLTGKDVFPKGWEIRSIMEIPNFRFISENVVSYEGGKQYFATADIEGIEIRKKGILYAYIEKPSRAQKQPIVNSVWFARMKDTYKVLCFTDVNKIFAKQSMLSSGFAGFEGLNGWFGFLYFTINSPSFHLWKDKHCTGATQISLTNEGLASIKIVVPESSVIEQYNNITVPIINQILTLQFSNSVLRVTRDLLLPKLISGEIRIENDE